MSGTIKSILTNRNFLFLWVAYGISALGDHLSEMSILAKLDALNPEVDVTPLQARMTFAFMLPFFLFGAVSGAIADRLPRRSVMISADLARAVIMFSFLALIDLFTPVFGVWGPFAPLFFVGLFATIFAPARSAMVPMLVHRDELVTANAMISTWGMIATMVAAVVGGELAEYGLIKTAFRVDASTFALSAACVFLISESGDRVGRHAVAPSHGFLQSVSAGLRYVSRHRRVAELIGVAVVFWFAGATVRSVLPAIVKHSYEGGFREMARFPMWIAIGLAAGAGILAILGDAVRSQVAMTWSLFGTGMSIVGLAMTVFVDMDPSRAHVIGAVFVVCSGMFGSGVFVSYQSLFQRFVPNQYLGRVFGVNNMATIGGLLVATGALAIPRWENVDRWVGWLLVLIALLLFATGGVALSRLLRSLYMDRQYALSRSLIEALAKFWYRCRRVGRCTIPRSGATIITANHGNYIDPLLIYSCCDYRRISFMIAAEYYHLTIVRYFIHLARCIPVRRGRNDISATKETVNRLRNGDAVGIFIGGGIHEELGEENLKNGAAMLALRTGATVIPAHISGTRYHKSVLKSLLTRYRVRIAFGPAVDLSEFSGGKGQDVMTAATRKIFDAIRALNRDPAGDHSVVTQPT